MRAAGYHETITRAYVSIVGAYLASFDEAVPLAARVDALVGGALGGRDLLFEYWTRERLLSSETRRAWAPPDRAALELAPVLRPRG